MTDIITVTGVVATPPRQLTTSEGLSIASFRLASTQRRYDRGAQKWVDGDTNWFTITCFRQLAVNVAESIEKGQRVVVTGRLRIREWKTEERAGTNIEIDADAVGHDLAWGTARYTRTIGSGRSAAEPGSPAASSPDSSADWAAAPLAGASPDPSEYHPDSETRALEDSAAVPF